MALVDISHAGHIAVQNMSLSNKRDIHRALFRQTTAIFRSTAVWALPEQPDENEACHLAGKNAALQYVATCNDGDTDPKDRTIAS